ncbi:MULTISPECIES: anaerobic glycerol-3-phosphate dehydrogenase subunit C [Caldilinea]|jgi:glycerol-3-phosphate dehydrogenase subunit C|uniref:Putative FAD-linked oxidase n=1 Tax=Caldilinea aerophila (strain DSM 14535 / JCM 11387 / NBRC 104270 / STL-6-O1) TaxID=926550 RepID=I0I0S8_CALAS|nr:MULTISPECIES: anaerobic glycerol-3-phosphate dehydrogenase subunit C [Caldilinea]MBO9391625.1 anaerobic glycerol-3-phosphate dehydrogenase subunit C [Caldilinea sp.]BAL98865.1 putative FAD-linked oxidase [Caldilinea aerophila DSM 14535 = NBRC 104270]GIV74551.1 MAG: sn-glycerol-3-phosphate dehydrogenase subunit C [Caldilinea sp.]
MAPLSWHSVDLTLDECIKCNICTSHCPVSAVTDLFPGPKYVGPQAQRFRENGQPHTPDHSVDYCSGCRVCNEVCPTGVKIAELNARARAQIVAEKGLPLRNRLLGRNELLGKLGSFAPMLANFGLHNPLSRLLAEKVMGIARHAPLPTWSTSGTFRDWLRRTRDQRLKSSKKVVYFHGCATMYYEPFIGKAAVVVLEHNGYEVIVPEQNCCGLPLLSNGEFNAARSYHRSNVGRLAGYARAGLPIVGTSTSCTLTLKEEAPELLDYHDEPATTLKLGTYDIFEWLRERYEAGELRTDFQPLPLKLPYHAPCQQRAHRIGKPALELMALIPELELAESHARCCGIAGTYGYKIEKYQIAMDVGAELFEFVKAQGKDVRYTACDSETCRWQLEHGTALPSRHPIEILAAAYGLYDLERRDVIAGKRDRPEKR